MSSMAGCHGSLQASVLAGGDESHDRLLVGARRIDHRVRPYIICMHTHTLTHTHMHECMYVGMYVCMYV